MLQFISRMFYQLPYPDSALTGFLSLFHFVSMGYFRNIPIHNMLLAILLIPVGSLSGQIEIRGHIRDSDGEAIIGANVYLQDTYDGTSSGEEGLFSFTTGEFGSHTLVASYLGFREFRQPVELGDMILEIQIELKQDAMELQHVVITAGSFETNKAGRSEVLKPLDILTTAGATGDIAGALNTLPGTQTVGESGRLYVRGGEGYETQTYIDGMQVQHFYCPAAPNTPGRTRFMPYMFSGTNFSTGGYSAEYGQALSSVLVLNSKFLATQERTDVSLMTVGVDLAHTQLWDDASLSAKVQYTNLDPYQSLIDQNIDWINAPTSLEGSAAYRKKISKTGILKVFTNLNRSNFSLNQGDFFDPEEKTKLGIDNRYVYLNALMQEKLGKAWTIRAGASYTGIDDQVTFGNSIVRESSKGLHLKMVMNRNIGGAASIKIGSEIFGDHFLRESGTISDKSPLVQRLREHRSAFFAESEVYITGSLLSRIGIRSDYSHASDQMYIEPRFSLALSTSKNSQVSAAFGLFHQNPQDSWRLAAADLRPENAIHYILNYQINHDRRTFRVEGYYKKYRNLVKYQSTSPYSFTDLSNAGQGYAQGIDLFWRDGNSIRNLEYWVSYSFLDTERDYREYPLARTPQFASKHNLSLVTKYFLSAIKSQVGLTYSFVSARPYHDPNTSEFLASKTPNYHDFSGNISYLMRQNIIVHFSVTNLLGNRQIFGYEFADRPNDQGFFPGRSIHPPAKRFIFLGVFFTFSPDPVLNQLPTL